MSFTEDQVRRYARHIILPGIGGDGQRELMDARILVIGAGGLGSPAAMYLGAAGVGTIGLVDFDRVELSNLQRQLLHDTDDVGRPKVVSARDRLTSLNPNVEVVAHETLLSSANAFDVLNGYDVVVDGTEQLRVFREIEARGWELLAFYHSHPHSEAYPSPTDRARAHWRDPATDREVPAYPGTAYVIASLLSEGGDEGDGPVVRAFRFEDGQPREEEGRVT